MSNKNPSTTENPIKTPIERPIEKPIKNPIEKPIEKPIQRPVKNPTEKPLDERPFDERSIGSEDVEWTSKEVNEFEPQESGFEKGVLDTPKAKTITIEVFSDIGHTAYLEHHQAVRAGYANQGLNQNFNQNPTGDRSPKDDFPLLDPSVATTVNPKPMDRSLNQYRNVPANRDRHPNEVSNPTNPNLNASSIYQNTVSTQNRVNNPATNADLNRNLTAVDRNSNKVSNPDRIVNQPITNPDRTLDRNLDDRNPDSTDYPLDMNVNSNLSRNQDPRLNMNLSSNRDQRLDNDLKPNRNQDPTLDRNLNPNLNRNWNPHQDPRLTPNINEEYFLHLTPSWYTDGTADLIRKVIAEVAHSFIQDIDYTTHPWVFKTLTGQGNYAALYIYPYNDLDATGEIINLVTAVTNSNGGKVKRSAINPTEHLKLQMICDFSKE